MATREDLKAAYREVLSEPAVLDRIALAILKRDCYLVDPSGKTFNIVGTTNLAKKINFMAHNDAQQLALTAAIGEGVEAVQALLEGWEEQAKAGPVLEDGTPLPEDSKGLPVSENGLQPNAEFVTPSAEFNAGEEQKP